jgi:hypothetical protein
MVEPMICNDGLAATPKPKKLPPKVNPKLGKDKATNASKNSAIKLYHRYQSSRNEPTLQDMEECYIVGDNLQAHLCDLGAPLFLMDQTGWEMTVG